MHLQTLEGLLAQELKTAQKVEEALVSALPTMQEAAVDQDLKTAFADHLRETRNHVRRLEKIITLESDDQTSGSLMKLQTEMKRMEGDDSVISALLQEPTILMRSEGDTAVKDAALIAAAQKVEHYEIALYGCAIAHAKTLDLDDVADLLEETFDEEEKADEALSSLAEGTWFSEGINEEADTLADKEDSLM